MFLKATHAYLVYFNSLIPRYFYTSFKQNDLENKDIMVKKKVAFPGDVFAVIDVILTLDFLKNMFYQGCF